METQTPILEQLEALRTRALDPNVDVATVQTELLAMVSRLKTHMDPRTLRNFLRLVAARAAIEAKIQRRHMERAVMFAQLVACEYTEEPCNRN